MKQFFILIIFIVFNNIGQVFGQEIEVDELPYFAGCEQYKANSKDKNKCSQSNLAYYLSRNLTFPAEAKQQNISGIVYVLFTVKKDGGVDGIKVLNDIGGGCGEVAQKIVANMPLWEAAKLKGTTIDYELRLPIHFKLDSENFVNDFDLFWGDIRFDEISLPSLDNYLSQQIIIRNEKGETVEPVALSMVYEHETTLKNTASKGNINKEMIKILRKAKRGGKITFTATLQKKGTFFELYRTFLLVE